MAEGTPVTVDDAVRTPSTWNIVPAADQTTARCVHLFRGIGLRVTLTDTDAENAAGVPGRPTIPIIGRNPMLTAPLVSPFELPHHKSVPPAFSGELRGFSPSQRTQAAIVRPVVSLTICFSVPPMREMTPPLSSTESVAALYIPPAGKKAPLSTSYQ
jgi:hypothetical protein